jgi:hypothetical protein
MYISTDQKVGGSSPSERANVFPGQHHGHLVTPEPSPSSGLILAVPASLAVLSSRTCVPEIVARAKEQHPYEVPGISVRPIDGGNPDYLAWVAAETTTDQH